MDTELELVRRSKAGDEQAFEQLVLIYEKKIYSMGLRYTGSSQDALDICQEVFLRLFRFIGQFNENSRFSTWVYRISANVCKDAVSHRHADAMPLGRDTDDEQYSIEISDLRYSPEKQFDTIELRDTIADGIMSLPQKYREIVIMRDINGLTYSEIGEALSIEEGTVKSRLARAREQLRTFLSAIGNISPNSQSNGVKGGRVK